MTGIPNRRSYDEKLQQEWELALSNNQSISLLMIDIDYFKLYNDDYGHQQGDYCLQEVAKSLQQAIEQSGHFVARYGGEEFSVILRDQDEKLIELSMKQREMDEILSTQIDNV